MLERRVCEIGNVRERPQIPSRHEDEHHPSPEDPLIHQSYITLVLSLHIKRRAMQLRIEA